MKVLKFIAKNTFLFYLISFTWGIITSLLGLLVMIPFLITGKVRVCENRLYGVFPKAFGSGWGFSLGCFFFTSWDCANNEHVKYHEMGHCVQNLVLGPLHLFVVIIPSLIRFWYRELKYERKGINPPTKYDDIWFENSATNLGNYVYRDIEIPTKYAYIVVNQATINNKIEYRRVLISYKSKKAKNGVVTYKGTRLIDIDKYFRSRSASLKYFFTDKHYYVEEVKKPEAYSKDTIDRMLNVKRKYHYYLDYIKKPVEFSVCSDSEAKKYLQHLK